MFATKEFSDDALCFLFGFSAPSTFSIIYLFVRPSVFGATSFLIYVAKGGGRGWGKGVKRERMLVKVN